jgi:ABC-type branched-subunit amino acid transport system substrate-binding protein
VKNKYSIAFGLLIILLFVTINYYPRNTQPNNPENNQLKDENTVKIAVTYMKLSENVGRWPHPVSEEKIKALVTMAEEDINQYCIDNQIETRFNYIPTPVIHKGGTPQGENPPGLDEMIQLNQSGINLIVGHDYSLANRYSLDYANEHKMLLLSPSGVGLGLSKPEDYLYKLSPNDYEDPEVYEKVYAQMIKELEYKAFITINTGRRSFYPNVIEETAKALNYSYRTTLVEYDINSDAFEPYLEKAADYMNDTIMVYGIENVCILVEPLWIDDVFLDVADKYPILSNITWFDYVGLPEELVTENDLEQRLAKYGFTRLIMYPADTARADVFYQRYVKDVGELPTPSRVYDEAARYDACWLMALSVLQANSSDPIEVKAVLPSVCESYKGILGNCTLNKYGDRVSTDYRVFTWKIDGEETYFKESGYYNSTNDSFIFYP